MEKEVYDAIKTIVQKRKESCIVPYSAPLSDIKALVGYDPLPDLRTLWYKHLIVYHQTINSFTFDIKDNQFDEHKSI